PRRDQRAPPRLAVREGPPRSRVILRPVPGTFAHLSPKTIHTSPLALRDDGFDRPFVSAPALRTAGPHGLPARPVDPGDGPRESPPRPHPRAGRGEQRAGRARGASFLYAQRLGRADRLHPVPRGRGAPRV